MNSKTLQIKSEEKWNYIFESLQLDWNKIYRIPATCCNNTKLHWFQYRLLHRILATNDLLEKMKIKTDNLCSLCGLAPEKIEHLFWQCPVVMEFWDSIDHWLLETINYSLNINKQKALFGILHNFTLNSPINYVLILTRYYIYKCKMTNKQLSIQVWKKEIKQFFATEKLIAIKNSYYEKFLKTWNMWLILFEVWPIWY